MRQLQQRLARRIFPLAGKLRCHDKTCKGCRRTLPFNLFPQAQVASEYNKPNTSKYIATEKLTVTKIQISVPICPECMPKKQKDDYKKRQADPERLKCEKLLNTAASRATMKGWAFNISVALVLATIAAQDFVCDLCGVSMVLDTGVSFMASIDRLNNLLGYSFNNFRMVIAELNTPGDANNQPPTRQVCGRAAPCACVYAPPCASD